MINKNEVFAIIATGIIIVLLITAGIYFNVRINKEGMIIDKLFYPAHGEKISENAGYYPTSYDVNIDDAYYVVVELVDEKKLRTRREYRVSEEDYYRAEIGKSFNGQNIKILGDKGLGEGRKTNKENEERKNKSKGEGIE